MKGLVIVVAGAGPAGSVGGKKTMNKSELIIEVATATGLTKKKAEGAYDALLGTVIEGLADGASVRTDLGTFSVKERPERTIKGGMLGPKGVKVIPAHRAPGFKFAADVVREVATCE